MSLRNRLLAGMVAVAVVLVVAAIGVSRTTENYLVGQVDNQLRRAARESEEASEPAVSSDQTQPDRPRRGNGTLAQRFPGVAAISGPEAPSSLYVAVVVGEELRTVRLPNLTQSRAEGPPLSAAEVQALKGDGLVTITDAQTGLRYRATVPDGRAVTAIYALPLEDVEGAVQRLRILEALAVSTVMAVLGLVTFWVLRLGVRPLKEMTATATAIGEGDLSHRIPESAPRTEAAELGTALNAMLERLEGSFAARSSSEDRLRQFVADASHELRTPVTTIRGYAELYRSGGLEDRDALAEAMRRTEQEAVRMASLVDDLLALARLDQGRKVERLPVDLATVVRDAAMDARAVDPDRSVTVDAEEPVMVAGDDGLLRQVVANLVANARVHTPPGTALHLRTGTRTGAEALEAVIEVSDRGLGMAPEVAARAFERFFRADAGRSRQSGGSGLGLAIVASVMAVHGGSAEIESNEGHGTMVRLILPLPGSSPPAHSQLSTSSG